MGDKMKAKITNCKICEDDFSYIVKRGRPPSICLNTECIRENRKKMRKPKPRVVRNLTCSSDGCDTTIEQHGKGRTIKWCDSCRSEIRAKQNAEYRKETFIPMERNQGGCIDCNQHLGTKTGRGKLTVRCATCMHKRKNEQARISAKKHYRPVVRSYSCSHCLMQKEQTGRGKLRKTCPSCLTVFTPAEIKKTVEIRKKRNDANIEGNKAQDATLAKEAKKVQAVELFDQLQKEQEGTTEATIAADILSSEED